MKPLIAITMGDPTGIGPEIVARALAGSSVHDICRPLVLGDPVAMERGIRITGVPLRLVELSPDEIDAAGEPGTVGLLPLSRLADADLQFGRPTAAAGDAVYRYIVEAARLCTAGTVAAMATAPINKEAMNRAGHDYPGHTELLAELTGISDFVMMLAERSCGWRW